MANISDRVGAYLSAKDGVIKLLGYGTYEGEFTYPGFSFPSLEELLRGMRKLTDTEKQECTAIYNKLCKTAKLKLDNGDFVWGHECSWDQQETIEAYIDSSSASLVNVKIVRDPFGRIVKIIEL